MHWLDLNINHLRVVVTLLSFVAFAGIVAWTFSKRNKVSFDDAAQLPFAADSRHNQFTHSSAKREVTSHE